MNELTGEIKTFASTEEAVKAGYDVELSNEEAMMLAKMQPLERLDWLDKRKKFLDGMRKYARQIEKDQQAKAVKKSQWVDRKLIPKRWGQESTTFTPSIKSRFKQRKKG